MRHPNAGSTITLLAGPPPAVKLRGEIDFRFCPCLRQTLHEAAESDFPGLDLDVSDLAYIDSSGIGSLIECAIDLAGRGRSLTLRSPNRFLTHALNIAGLSRFFRWDGEPHHEADPRKSARQGAASWQHAAFTLPCRRELLGIARERIVALAGSMPFTRDERDDIELAIGEGISNAMRHGCHASDARIEIECKATAQGLTIRVTDPGKGFDPEAIPIPTPADPQEGGMGLHFMRITMDEISFAFTERGTTLTLVKRLRSESRVMEGPGAE